MSAFPSFLPILAVLLTPIGLVAALTLRSRRRGRLRRPTRRFRFAVPAVSQLPGDDPDIRRVSHDVDAIRTRFENQPVWPHPGSRGERR
ncbi:hypothetical protein [Mycolicibacterium palauense]|uniref:hypothetical protein n=1 Tax=Mycolicibacterium palauense TaxID=2034511 RepID=UPI000BFF1051|nr:hypothetical protein [Mycolicibacterium palauense]